MLLAVPQAAQHAAVSHSCTSQNLPSFDHSYMLPACNAAATLHSCASQSSQCRKAAVSCSCEERDMQLWQAQM